MEKYQLRVVILTDGIFPFVIGGMQKHSFYLTKFLVLCGLDVTLVHCTSDAKLPTHEQVLSAMELQESRNFKSFALKFPRLPAIPGHYLWESYFYSQEVFRYIKAELNSFDLVYAKGFSAWRLIQLKRAGLTMPPTIVNFHGYEMYQVAPNLRVKLEHYLLRLPVRFNAKNADYVMSYGGRITQLIGDLGIQKDKILEIPSGIELSWIRKSIPTHQNVSRRFLFIGRFERRKGIEELHKVLRSLQENFSFRFDFVGPIPKSCQLDDGRVTYHGKIIDKERLWQIMDNCEVLVTPSHSEGMPNVILEGMARGLAVIATDVGAVAELVDKTCGWLLNSCDIDQLKSVIQEVSEMSQVELSEKRRNSLDRVRENFSWNSIAERSVHIFKELSLEN